MFHPLSKELAWENRRHFATPPVVSPRNNVWEMSAEIPYWWRVTTQGSASDWSCRVGNLLQPIRSTIQIWVMTRHQYGISALISQRLFCRETSGGVAKCRLFSQATRQLKLAIMRLTKGGSSAHFSDVWISDEVPLRCLIYLSEKKYKEVKKNTWIFSLFSKGWKLRSFN